MKLLKNASLSLPACTRLLSLLAAGAMALTATGCGDDAGITGPSVIDDDGVNGAQDGALTGDGALLADGAATDPDATTTLDVAILGSDGASTGGSDTTVVNPNTSCTGKCGVYDKKAACQCDDKCTQNGDCCGDFQAQCGTVANTCGDGKCTPPETQTTCPGDCGTVLQPSTCKGKCGTYDKAATCQCDNQCSQNGDCCGDYKTECGAVANTCGDGKCTPPEDATSCPADCGTVTPAGSCVGKCGQYNKSWTCQCDAKCTTNGDCCADLATACPGTTGGGTPIVTCVETNCATEVATCDADATCKKVLDCAKNCADQQCIFGCVQSSGGGGFQLPNGLQAVYTCGNNAKCFQQGGGGTTPACNNNGKCDAGETTANCPADCPAGGGGTPSATSCAGQCGKINTAGGFGGCQCQTWCVQAGNCCSDYQALCVATPPTSVCGNGTCDSGETNATCPADCPASGGGTTTADQCVQSKCATQYASCAKDPACLTALPCVEGGKQIWNCGVTSVQTGLTLGQVQGCATQNKCF